MSCWWKWNWRCKSHGSIARTKTSVGPQAGTFFFQALCEVKQILVLIFWYDYPSNHSHNILVDCYLFWRMILSSLLFCYINSSCLLPEYFQYLSSVILFRMWIQKWMSIISKTQKSSSQLLKRLNVSLGHAFYVFCFDFINPLVLVVVCFFNFSADADKVLKKLRGEVDPESTQNPRWTASRKRRPGILG